MILNRQETTAARLLAAIASHNARGEDPDKLQVIGEVPGKARSGQYRAIAKLAKLGLVSTGKRKAGRGHGYSLHVTEKGRRELAEWGFFVFPDRFLGGRY